MNEAFNLYIQINPSLLYSSSTNNELNEKLALLEEHEKLSASLAALTRHFAHVQLRLQQVVSAPTPEDREVKQSHSEKKKRILLLLLEFTC